MKLKINRFPFFTPLLLLIALVFMFTYVASSLSVVHAQGSTPMKPEDEAKLYQGYRFLEACASIGFDSGSKSRESLNNGSAFHLGTFDTGGSYRVGYLVDPNDGDGVFSCEDGGNVQSAMAAVGMSGVELFIDTGVYSPNQGGGTGSEFELSLRDNSERRERITAAIRNKHLGIQLSDKASHLAQYFNLAKTFDKHCVSSWDGSGNREVQWVNGDGTVATRKFFQRDTGSSGFNVGFGMDEDGGDDGSMQCDTILNQLNAYAGAAGSAQAAYATATGDTSLSTTPNADGSEGDSCESSGGPLGWIMCPVAAVLDSITGFLDDQIEDKLVLRDKYFRDESGDRLKAAWTQIRNIAYVILIPIMLVMVIGTALGFEVFSAYTVKKALPRMIIAIIFITLSWYICLFIVEFVNALGAGIKGLVIYPFREVEVNNEIMKPQPSLREALNQARVTVDGGSSVGSTAGAVGLGATAAIAGFAGFATGALSISIIMSTLFTAALVLGAVFLLLIARQMILIALFLLAPLAILAWIFPGNDKLWKLWWSAFTKLLLLFPVIMLSIAVGQIFALVVGLSGGVGNDLIETVMIIAAYILPYFFIPFLFKWAGGLFGNLAGMVNDRERGVLDRLKKGRAEKRSEGWGKFKAGTGTGFGQSNALTRRVGTGIGAGVGGGKGIFGTGITQAQRNRGRARMDQLNRENMLNQVMKSDSWNGVNQDDNALHAGILLQDMSAKDAIAQLQRTRAEGGVGASDSEAKRAVAAWQASGLGGRAAAIAAAQQLVTTGTGYADLEHMTSTLARAAGGNTSTASAMAGFANSETKKVGRGDLAPGFSNLQSLVHERMGNVSDPTHVAYDQAVVGASRGQDSVTLLRGKTPEVQNLADSLDRHLTEQHRRTQDTMLTQDQRNEATAEMLRTAAQIEQLDQSKGYASDNNQAVIGTLMDRTHAIRVGTAAPGTTGPINPSSVRGRIESDASGELRQVWNRAMPKVRDPRDPNLPT